MTADLSHTALYDLHVSLGARIVPFAGWEMPIQYQGILAETREVRSEAGIFDVSHMGRLEITGPQTSGLLDWVTTANASSMRARRARYALICNEQGGIIDDVVFYRRSEEEFLLVCNASNRPQVVEWIKGWAAEKFPETSMDDVTESTAMIALQGPQAVQVLGRISPLDLSALRFFASANTTAAGIDAFVGRTGYTGEDGFELTVAAGEAAKLWRALMEQGASPCGLGARDILRLEAGLPLHGNDIDPTTTPIEASLDRFAKLDHDFVGADVVRRQLEEGPPRRLVGLNVEGRSIARNGYSLISGGKAVGYVTSGTHSPTLGRVIAMGYLDADTASSGREIFVDIRGKLSQAEMVDMPFYSRGASK